MAAEIIKTPEEKKAEATPNGDTIDLRKKVTVYSTDKDPHHKTGESFQVHPKLAQHLVEIGMASEEPQEAKSDKFDGGGVGRVVGGGDGKNSNNDIEL